jgi:hypothetical protein
MVMICLPTRPNFVSFPSLILGRVGGGGEGQIVAFSVIPDLHQAPTRDVE